MTDEIYKTLYTGEDGMITSLDEVQLLDDFPQERISKLIDLLHNDDLYIVYQAILILSAWGVDEGLRKIDEFIDTRPDKQIEFEPHRIYGKDNVYDVLADALYISIFNTDDEQQIVPAIKKILALYGEVFFESRLKSVLLKMNATSSLSNEIKEAMLKAINSGFYYQASQLLPVLSKISPTLVADYLPIFTELATKDKRIKYNLEEIS